MLRPRWPPFRAHERKTPTAPRTVVIVGAGPAGLATAACLDHRGVDVLVLRAGPSVGSSWRHHYDRLHLHTAKEHSHLPGLPFDEARTVPVARRCGRVPRGVRGPPSSRRTSGGGRPPRYGPRPAGSSSRARAPSTRRAPWCSPRAPTASRTPRACPTKSASGARCCTRRATAAVTRSRGSACSWSASATQARRSRSISPSAAPGPHSPIRTPVNVVPRDFLGMPTQLTSIRTRWAPLRLADELDARVAARVRQPGAPRVREARARTAVVDQAAPSHPAHRRRHDRRHQVRRDRGQAGFSALHGDRRRLRRRRRGRLRGRCPRDGLPPALEELVDVPGVLDAEGYPRDWKRAAAAAPFPGTCSSSATRTSRRGFLREIARGAEAVAAALAAG